ncbi:MAG TPA: hypothetical protein VFV68_01115, partial [Agriterribacter sp.]|nr:hypothetical protein [Agriterribacter sp.]
MHISCKDLIAGVAVLLVCHTASIAQKQIRGNRSDNTAFTGRVEKDSSGTIQLYWPGTSVTTKFEGTVIKATLKDEHGRNYYMVVVDNDSTYALKIDSIKKEYTLAAGLPPGQHTVALYRLADWFGGKTTFYGFTYEPGAKTFPLPPKKRRIEFYGNSITVGAGMLERERNKSGLETNNYLSYGALTARHYNAAATFIASSGIGLMVSWGSLIMPDIYDHLNPADSNSKWDFSKTVPGVVVVNLFQNDAALMTRPDHDQYIRRFGKKPPSETEIINAYYGFIRAIRAHYPDAHIICALGSMGAVAPGSPWPDYIKKAVVKLGD